MKTQQSLFSSTGGSGQNSLSSDSQQSESCESEDACTPRALVVKERKSQKTPIKYDADFFRRLVSNPVLRNKEELKKLNRKVKTNQALSKPPKLKF